ncbi:hypothetical protein GC069_11780, partial [Neisseria meningitidis]|nr:hypothetical protein [Neisseria meningitidis]
FGDGAVAGQVLDVVSFALGQLRVAHGNLSCRKGRMLPHTGLFLLGKVALQMRIRRRLKRKSVSDGISTIKRRAVYLNL